MVGDKGGLAAGFVGVEAVVTDGLTPPCSAHAVWLRFKLSRYRGGAWLALGRDVEKSGGDEVGGFEDLEVALGVVVRFGVVNAGCLVLLS